MPESNLIDRAIGAAFPGWGASRLQARARMEGAQYVRAMYDGATKSSRAGFRGVGGSSANSEIQWTLPRLRDVSRDLVRNNPYAAAAINGIATNVVGDGITPAVVCDNTRQKKRIQDLVKEHLETPLLDFDGRNNLYGLQNLITRTMAESGEALLVRYTPPARLRLPVPMQVRVLEPDYLDSSKYGEQANGNVCFQGIEFEKSGRRVAYWLFDEHPGGGTIWSLPQSRRVPAEDVAHIYRVDRPGQARGVPWAAPVVVTLWDLHDYEGAELLRQKIAACFAVFIKGEPTRTLAGQISATETSAAGSVIETVEPGTINRLPAGTEIEFAAPPTVTGFGEVTRHGARKVACGIGVPYEIVTGDLSQVTFVSGRLGRLQFGANVGQWRWQIVIPHGCATIARWFLEAAAIPLNGPAKARLDWSPPPYAMVDPEVETKAAQARIRAGLSTRSEETRSLGFDPEAVEDEFEAENARADDKKLRFDSDGRFPLNGGALPAPANVSGTRPGDAKPVDTTKPGDN
jgi:lambda family phage portal protein